MKKIIPLLFVLLVLLSLQVSSIKTCNVADIKSTIKDGAYEFLTDPSSSQVNPEDIRELFEVYKSSKDKSTIDCDVTSEKSKTTREAVMSKIKGSLKKRISEPVKSDRCSDRGGYSYTTEEYCLGESITASDTDRCCSQPGVKGNVAVTNSLENGSIQANLEVTPGQEQSINISLPEDAVVIEATIEITSTVNATIDAGADGNVDATISAETTEVTPNLAPEINEFIDTVKDKKNNQENKESLIGAVTKGQRKISVPLIFKAESTGNVYVSKINFEYIKPQISFFSKFLTLIESIF